MGPPVSDLAGCFCGEEKRFGGEGQMGWTGLGWALAGLVVLLLFFSVCFVLYFSISYFLI